MSATPETDVAPGPDGRSTRVRAAGFRRLSVLAAVPMAVITALWITGGRVLFDAGGLLVVVFAVTVLPVYLIAMGISAVAMIRDARRTVGGVTTPAIGAVQTLTWVLALLFGFLIPDRRDGVVFSAASRVLGEDFLGLSAGFGNTIGILTFVAAFATMFLALAQEKRSRNRLAGRPATEDEILDAQGYEDGQAPPDFWIRPGG